MEGELEEAEEAGGKKADGVEHEDVRKPDVSDSDGSDEFSLLLRHDEPARGGDVKSPLENVILSRYWRFSTIMGFCDILIDVDKYFMYLYLINTTGCDFETSYGALYLAYTILYLVWSPLAGVLSDLLQPQILWVMTACSGLIVAAYGILLSSNLTEGQLLALFSMRCVSQIQLSSATWKAIKMFVEDMVGPDPILHEAAMNKIGTLGDLSTEVFEIGLVATALGSALWLENYGLVTSLMNFGVIFISASLFLLSLSVLLWHKGLFPQGLEVNFTPVRRDSLTLVQARTQVMEFWMYFEDRMHYFLTCGILTNCACLSMVSSCFEYMFDGPVTLTRATLSTTHHGLCDGAVDFILMQALMLQLMYLFGGFVYFVVIMRMHPARYYGTVFPVTSVMFMVATISPFLPMPEVAAAGIISAVTVVSYYMSIYNTYMVSGASRAEYFGFVQALTSVAVGVAGVLPALLQLLKASQVVLMTVAFLMATWGLMQSLHLWRTEFASAVTLRLE